MSTKKLGLWRMWTILQRDYKKETRDVYNKAVENGSTETYEEFVEQLRKEWFEEMMSK